jgi:hypothetical protein
MRRKHVLHDVVDVAARTRRATNGRQPRREAFSALASDHGSAPAVSGGAQHDGPQHGAAPPGFTASIVAEAT